MVEVDEKTKKYLKGRTNKPYEVFQTDEDAESLSTMYIDVNDLEPQIACPHNVDNVKPVSEVEGTPHRPSISWILYQWTTGRSAGSCQNHEGKTSIP